jgi:hypothetical protein
MPSFRGEAELNLVAAGFFRLFEPDKVLLLHATGIGLAAQGLEPRTRRHAGPTG